MGDACVRAGKAKHPVLVMHASGEVSFERVVGEDWRVKTALNHKTKWGDHWYDVTCVVGWTSPEVTVRSVETTARQ